jgi:transposase
VLLKTTFLPVFEQFTINRKGKKMPGRRHEMRRIREVLRYRYEHKLSMERIAGSLGISKGSVFTILNQFAKCGLKWPLDETITDSVLEENVYGPTAGRDTTLDGCFDKEYIRKEMTRKYVTLQLLWREYHDDNPAGMSRATFYRHSKEALPDRPLDMRMIHKGGDKLFVDYSGDGLFHIDRKTGEIFDVEVFVACWGASSFTFAEARPSQKTPELCVSHVNAFEYFGCVPHALVPDNFKSGVEKPCRYEPRINLLYEKLTQHYGVSVLPARIRKPKDKAVVESSVGFVQRYIFGRLRNRQFFSLHEINVAIREELEHLNNEPMQLYGGKSRRQRFEEIDKPNAQPLPAQRFTITDVKYDVGVAPNYHIRYDDHFYSVPHSIARKRVDVYLSGDTLEIYHDGVHLCRHRKELPNFAYTTVDSHMPSSHRFVRGWSEEWFVSRAAQIGIATAEAAQQIMKRHKHPQQGFNSVMGILNLVKQYTAPRVEAASRRALRFRSVSYRGIKSILDKNLDKENIPNPTTAIVPIEHENVRGADYFQNNQQAQG